jgi:hypothetical protein
MKVDGRSILRAAGALDGGVDREDVPWREIVPESDLHRNTLLRDDDAAEAPRVLNPAAGRQLRMKTPQPVWSKVRVQPIFEFLDVDRVMRDSGHGRWEVVRRGHWNPPRAGATQPCLAQLKRGTLTESVCAPLGGENPASDEHTAPDELTAIHEC